MSASREKKQRQGATGLSQREIQAQKAAAQKRRNMIIYSVIGAVCVVLVVALLVWNSNFFQRRTTAATVGDTQYDVADLSYYYYNAYLSEYMMAQYGYSAFDPDTPADEQTYDEESGQTYYDYFMESALETLKTTTAAYDAALADGYTSDDVKDEVDEAIQSAKDSASTSGYVNFKQYLLAQYGEYMTESSYRTVITRQAIANRYISDYQESLEFSDEEIQAYYDENKDSLDTFTYSYLVFNPAEVDNEDESMTDEEVEAAEEASFADAKDKADAAAQALESGSSVEDVAEEYEVESYSADASSVGSSLSSIYKEWLQSADRQAGDVTVIENAETNCYVVVFHDRYLDETPTVDTRRLLVAAEMDEDADEPTQEQMDAAKAKAEELLAQWESGDKTAESFGALADENTDENTSAEGGLFEAVYQGRFASASPEYDTWLFEEGRQEGDTAVVESEQSGSYGYFVVYYQGQNDPVWWSSCETALLSEAMTTWQEELVEGYAAALASGADYLR